MTKSTAMGSYHAQGLKRSMNGTVSTVLVTYPDEGTARAISRTLVEQRLAACSNIFSIGSIYRWEGDIVESAEHASLLKIRSEDFQIVEETIRRLHPYEVPCIVRYDVMEGLDDYLSWVICSTDR